MYDWKLSGSPLKARDPGLLFGAVAAILTALMAAGSSQSALITPSQGGQNETFVLHLTPSELRVNELKLGPDTTDIFGPYPCLQTRVPRLMRIHLYADADVTYGRLSKTLSMIQAHCLYSVELHIYASQLRRSHAPTA